MGFSRKRIIKIGVILVFLCCTLFANFFALRMIVRAGVDAYFYDKLLVAYTIGESRGLKIELSKILVTEKLPRELMLAKDFAARLVTLTNPEAFLQDKVDKSKKMINSIRNLRSAAMALMLILFGWQLMVKSTAKFKSKQSLH